MPVLTQEQRRHQRIRFGQPPAIRLGYAGEIAEGWLENLSLSGLMARCATEFAVGHRIGCEFSVFGALPIDVSATLISRVGDLYGMRFDPGPLNRILIDEALEAAMASGQASVLSMREQAGRRVMRILGGLNASLSNDIRYSLAKVGVDEIDAAGVTAVDEAGLALCQQAVREYGVRFLTVSPVLAARWPASPGAMA